ncbi:uncharacterized protein EAF01_006016 [Botrytis porri]|uniref:Plastocyanin-like domain-containing protein n=1 Tax=Botrytis porri TaxID=87229 RepID=A0A4Z1L5E4_9HELO|nr:uncharacterized protein EAF01_006016 [Botrytis porri]KAF7905495.1 hypothetical protein EAF01_006016 [Botrytis porri]TGO92091.1 hypothetical protein BPOR_0010g00030 [Botrytis porri]
MKNSFFSSMAKFASLSLAVALPTAEVIPSALEARQSCANIATTRSVTRGYWLVVQNTTLSADGVACPTLNFDGTTPGPQITADWGDNVIVHATNKLTDNGTSIHWHGIRQLNNAQYDGVPGITQCPIAPGDTLTYKFYAGNYGSSWYHSHFILQYGDGFFGPLVINGPATANYDVDLGMLFWNYWNHVPVQSLWDKAKTGAPPTLLTGLMNGINTYNGAGKKFQTTFKSGMKYRIRVVSTAVDGHFQFSTDGHSFQVIAMDFVPIVQGTGVYTATTALNLVNPPRRDVMTLPNGGHLVIAFQIDNPGSWLMHCHVAWHASEGLALQVVESEGKILPTIGTAGVSTFQDTCAAWNAWTPTEPFPQDDSGI